MGVFTDYLFAPADPGAVLDTLADERTRLVTLTITGSGYPTGGEPDPQDPDVVADVERPGQPGTAFGYIVEGLDRRRRAGLAPFTVLSCDNMQNNGATTRAAVVGTARLRDPELADWIEAAGRLPEQHGGPDHAGDDRRRPRDGGAGARAGGPVAGGHRAVLAVDRRGQLLQRPAAAGAGRCAVRPQGGAVRGDEDADAQRRPLRAGLPRAPRRLRHERRGDGRPARARRHRRLPAGGIGVAAHGAGDRPGGLPADPAGAVQQPADQRPAGPAVPARLDQGAGIRAAVPATGAGPGPAARPPRARPRVLDAVPARRGPRRAPIEIEDDLADRLRPLAVSGGTDPRPLLSEQDVFGCLSNDVRLAAELEHALQLLERGPHHAAAATGGPPPLRRRTGEEDTCVA